MSSTQQLLLGEGAGGAATVFIEDVFSCFLYTGNGSTQTITNGIDLSTKGGLVWLKSRSLGGEFHRLFDTSRGVNNLLATNATFAQQTGTSTLTAFNTTGFNLGSDPNGYGTNTSAATYVSWTFRKQAKFFDVVTYTGTGSNTTIAHSLGSIPGSIIIKRTDTAADWAVYHRSLANTQYLVLNSTAAAATGATWWNSTTPTSSVFSLGTNSTVNASGGTYVAYIFAHDAGGFGLTGTDNVISCGSFTTDGSGNFSVNLGYEPQWVMIKSTNNTGVSAAQQNWIIMDSMRGLLTQSGNGARLRANTDEAESSTNDFGLTATGFESLGNMSASAPFIYIAIRRGPMKVPTVGTSVFTPLAYTNSTDGVTISSLTYPADLVITDRINTTSNRAVWDRLRGATRAIYTNLTNAQQDVSDGLSSFASNVGYTTGSGGNADNTVNGSQINWVFRRAPSFFDEVCYTGTGSLTTITHNLAAVPELMIVKRRDTGEDWNVYNSTIGNTAYLRLNTTAASATAGGDALWGSTTPTSSVFTVKTSAGTNASAGTFVAYLFATAAGVSKVGSYTGTATTKQIDCGFTAGARFVLIKRTDSTGDWYVWDTARGIVAGNDSYLLLNSTAAEVTSTDYIDTYSAGFEISSTAPAAINANGGSFIFFAVA